LWFLLVLRLGPEQGFDGTPFVHGPVVLGDLVEREMEVEHPAGVDPALPDELDEMWQEPTDGAGPPWRWV
jgi:hypothetical protein